MFNEIMNDNQSNKLVCMIKVDMPREPTTQYQKVFRQTRPSPGSTKRKPAKLKEPESSELDS